MATFPFFSNKIQTVLVRCTYCYDEFYLSPREVRLLETKNTGDTVCPVKEECDMCHIGFVIPVNYTNKHGKTYRFHEMKPKIKNLDPNTVTERIFSHDF
ncbi:MAG: hypothetical protein NUV74_15365 [Candidatus Brocadiaceae bacterium]|nr:hypothetical protein [Candidatus Brocadiaceae bacterium]